ncbi:hypothetical protein J3Q64DRAFT_1769533 [Phycomyces blakesleeanus]|uniref:Uncharacterized protein n=1 Tax=Phycomyces blakesleeanus TaxID=4837 RepID=A0ABR3ALM4_PHYBL
MGDSQRREYSSSRRSRSPISHRSRRSTSPRRRSSNNRSPSPRRRSHRPSDRSASPRRSHRSARSPDDRHGKRASDRSVDDKSRHRSSHSDRKHRRSPSPETESSSSEDEDRRRSHKKHKKEKKHKKSKKSKKTKKSKLGSVGDQWGKFGVIYEADIFTKEAEFQAWLIEVKHVDVESVNNIKRKELFIDFMEDYNTATMTHEKFYDLSKWEARQRALRMGEAPPTTKGVYDFKDDEEQLRQQQRQAARLVASKQPTLTMSQHQLEELSKVNRERIQAERMRRLGLTPKESMGVRYEYEQQ